MCRFIETIRIENGSPQNIKFHQKRFRDTVKSFDLLIDDNLDAYIDTSEADKKKIYKYRIVYGKNSLYKEILEYQKRYINSLKVVESDLKYGYKFEDRSEINKLYSQKEDCDDILIVKNGKITDSSYCNIALFNSESWFTPRSPLLKGTMRELFLSEGLMLERDIYISDLKEYTKIALFNAMIPWEDKILLSTDNIHI